ncbi:hypothetical protein SAMN05660236_1697 [Ohtaekwangia koreensis]|uniref:Uncharacterized protein n=1 Tax=Ohtaekwangia koreensis TaxID=688867 RepID=A0A1T5K175_9BACT|nr:hypothetical protein SAMN05660236_1697 [Ohtaekwangia koreensis]
MCLSVLYFTLVSSLTHRHNLIAHLPYMPSGLRSCKLEDQKSIYVTQKKYITENTRDKNQSLTTIFLKFTKYIT